MPRSWEQQQECSPRNYLRDNISITKWQQGKLGQQDVVTTTEVVTGVLHRNETPAPNDALYSTVSVSRRIYYSAQVAHPR